MDCGWIAFGVSLANKSFLYNYPDLYCRIVLPSCALLHSCSWCINYRRNKNLRSNLPKELVPLASLLSLSSSPSLIILATPHYSQLLSVIVGILDYLDCSANRYCLPFPPFSLEENGTLFANTTYIEFARNRQVITRDLGALEYSIAKDRTDDPSKDQPDKAKQDGRESRRIFLAEQHLNFQGHVKKQKSLNASIASKQSKKRLKIKTHPSSPDSDVVLENSYEMSSARYFTDSR